MKRHYDLIFGIGRACSCSQSLRAAGLQLASFPWDWVGDPGARGRVDVICNDFKGWMDLKDLEHRAPHTIYVKEYVFNRRNELLFLHDFKDGIPIAEQFPKIEAKYARRIARLNNCIKSAKAPVLAVCIDAPHLTEPTSLDEIRECRRLLGEKYPGTKFEMLLINREPGRDFANRIEEEPEPGLMRAVFEYKDMAPGRPVFAINIPLMADYLKSRFTVRDYRTPAEYAAYKAHQEEVRKETRIIKMKEVGASNRFEYLLIRLWRKLAGAPKK